jgi:iron complex transport system substrate-binding protein
MATNTGKIATVIIVAIIMLAVGFVGGYYMFRGQQVEEVPKEIVLIDDLGREVTLDKPAERVVSLAAAATRTLYDLGAFDKVVGVDKYSDDPPEAQNKTVVGSTDIESIVALEPDLVIAWWYYEQKLQQLEELGIPVIYIHPTTIEGIYFDILLLGKAVGAEEKAEDLVSNLKTRVAYIEALVKNLTKTTSRPKVYLELYSPYKTVGRNTFTHQMIELAGGINIAGNLTGYPKLSDEYIIEANPDVILYESDLPLENFTNRAGWDQINAVKNEKIYHLDRHIATASPRFIEGLEFMIWAFFEVNVSETSGYITIAATSKSAVQTSTEMTCLHELFMLQDMLEKVITEIL